VTAAPPAPLLLPCGDGLAEVRCSGRADGDFHADISLAEREPRRQRFMPGVWTQPAECHGTTVLRVARPGEHDGAVADAVVTSVGGAILGVWVGDCAPVAFVDACGQIGAAHAGWRGASAGILERTVEALAPVGPTRAVLGPCIRACCYEFGPSDLEPLVARFGAAVAGRTSMGRPALDMAAVVVAALAPLGIGVDDLGGCTGCSPAQLFSHRRGEGQRQIMAVVRRGGDD
jgi:polyphenol oxidase